MSRTIEAIYENGVFKPLTKIDIKEHTKLTITVTTEYEAPPLETSRLDGIIDLAEDCSDSNLSTDHDAYLYGAGSR